MTAQPNLSLKKSLKELSRTTSGDPVQPRWKGAGFITSIISKNKLPLIGLRLF